MSELVKIVTEKETKSNLMQQEQMNPHRRTYKNEKKNSFKSTKYSIQNMPIWILLTNEIQINVDNSIQIDKWAKKKQRARKKKLEMKIENPRR